MASVKRPTPVKIKGSSGEHPAVVAIRRKLESIADNDFPEMDRVAERLANLSQRPPAGSDRPPRPEDLAAMLPHPKPLTLLPDDMAPDLEAPLPAPTVNLEDPDDDT